MKNDKLLIIDYYPTVREAIKLVLEEDFKVIEANSGNEALKILKQDPTIFMTFLSLDYSGMEELKTLANIKTLSTYIQVYLLTASTEYSIISRAMELGACGYIEKPFSIDDLYKAILKMKEK